MPNLRGALLIALCMLLSSGVAGAQASNARTCTSSIQVRFDRYGMTPIPAGASIWFTAVLKGVRNADGSGITAPIRIDVRNAQITFGGWAHVVTMPDSTVVVDPAITVPRRLWTAPNHLTVAYSPSQISDEALFDAFPYVAPEEFIPRSSGPVRFSVAFSASRPGVTIDWAWSASVYSQIGAIGSFRLKPLSGSLARAEPQAGAPEIYENEDAAGTPEAYKQNVVGGAMGNGAPNYTGTRSESASVIACESSEPAPTAPAQPMEITPPRMQPFVRMGNAGGAAGFASPVTQRVAFGDGSLGQAVDRCYVTDLCALISYPNGDRLAIYSGGAARCDPYVLHFDRTNGGRTIYGFSRYLDRDESPGDRCPTMRTTRIVMNGGRTALIIAKNRDGTLRFTFASP
jgi:hypothetical protein